MKKMLMVLLIALISTITSFSQVMVKKNIYNGYYITECDTCKIVKINETENESPVLFELTYSKFTPFNLNVLNKFKNNFIVSVGIGCDYKNVAVKPNYTNIVINPTYYFGIGKKFNDLILRNELIYTQVINQFDYGVVVSYKITKGIYLTYSVNTLENRVGLAFSNN